MKVQSISTGNTPHVSFEVLLKKLLPRFRYFVKNILRYKADNADDAVQELVTLAYISTYHWYAGARRYFTLRL